MDLDYGTTNLVMVVNDLRGSPHAVCNQVFGREITHDTEEIRFDKGTPNRGLAAWVSPLVEGKVLQTKRFSTRSIAPGYIKIKTPLDQNRPFQRAYGEQITGGQYSPAQRAMMHLREELEQHVEFIENRLEWMSCHALVNDGYVIESDDYGKSALEFGRPSSQSIILSGDDLWTDSASNPSDDLLKWARIIAGNGGGAARMVIMGLSAFMAFRSHAAVKDKWDWASNALNMSDVNTGAQFEPGLQYRGMYDGFAIYTHMDWYISDGIEYHRNAAGNLVERTSFTPFGASAAVNIEEGTLMPYIPETSVILCDPSKLMGTKGFGAIRDEHFVNMPSQPRVTRSWVQNDPGQRFILTQSAPLVFPFRVESSLHAKVA